MPVCGFPSLLVRTRQKIHSPYWPRVVHVFCPLTMYLLPRRSALGLDRGQIGSRRRVAVALAPPHPPLAMPGKKRCCWAALPKAWITGATITGPKGTILGAPANAVSSSNRCASAPRSSRGRQTPSASRNRASPSCRGSWPSAVGRRGSAPARCRPCGRCPQAGCPRPANFFTKSSFFGGKSQVHGSSPSPRWLFSMVTASPSPPCDIDNPRHYEPPTLTEHMHRPLRRTALPDGWARIE